MDQLFYTVTEASYICDVSQPTIRKAIKEHKMKTYTDDKGAVHIYGPHLWKYKRELITKKLMRAADDISKSIRKLDISQREYLKELANFENYDENEGDEGDKLRSCYIEAHAKLIEANNEYLRKTNDLRKLEYDATKIYEVDL